MVMYVSGQEHSRSIEEGVIKKEKVKGISDVVVFKINKLEIIIVSRGREGQDVLDG